MIKRLNHYFKELISARTDEIGQRVLMNNRRNRELNLKIIEVQHALMENLPPQLQPLVTGYDEAKLNKTAYL